MGRSEHANTLVVDNDLKVLSIVGWVPRVTFFLSAKEPGETRIWRMRLKNITTLSAEVRPKLDLK